MRLSMTRRVIRSRRAYGAWRARRSREMLSHLRSPGASLSIRFSAARPASASPEPARRQWRAIDEVLARSFADRHRTGGAYAWKPTPATPSNAVSFRNSFASGRRRGFEAAASSASSAAATGGAVSGNPCRGSGRRRENAAARLRRACRPGRGWRAPRAPDRRPGRALFARTCSPLAPRGFRPRGRQPERVSAAGRRAGRRRTGFPTGSRRPSC